MKSDPKDYNRNTELSVSEIGIFQQFGIRKYGPNFKICILKLNAVLKKAIGKID